MESSEVLVDALAPRGRNGRSILAPAVAEPKGQTTSGEAGSLLTAEPAIRPGNTIQRCLADADRHWSLLVHLCPWHSPKGF